MPAATLIAGLKQAGVWSRFEAYVLAAHTAQAARLSWQADACDLTPVSSPAIEGGRSYTGNGSTPISMPASTRSPRRQILLQRRAFGRNGAGFISGANE